MTNFDEIKYYLAKKPFIYYKVDQNYIGIFDNSFEDKQKFSFGIDSEESSSFTTNSLVLFNINNERSFLGFLYSKKSVATVSKTIHIKGIVELNIKNIHDVISKISSDFQSVLTTELNRKISIFSKELSQIILGILWESERENIIKLFNLFVKKKPDSAWLQEDVIKFSLSISDVDNTFSFDKLEIKNHEYSGLINLAKTPKILEDNIINFDFDHGMDKLDKKEKYITGKAIFSSKARNEKITIYTANKNILENIFGADLIYVNNIQNNIVMIQYKMLEKESKDWVFRDRNNQLNKEILRMDSANKLLNNNYINTEYRLNPSPFFLRFIKRKIDDSAVSFCISLEHYKKITELSHKFLKNQKIGFDSMGKHYIGKKELEGLIRSGYVGTYSSDTEMLSKIFELLSEGDDKNNFVISFRNKIEN